MNTLPTIFVIEPDQAIAESIKNVAAVLELRCETYTTGQEFLDAFDRHRPGCLVLEIRISGMNGLQVQQALINMDATLPVIFLTASASVSIAVHAMRMGALHFLEKPFHEHDLWSAIQEAIHIDGERRRMKSVQETIDAGVSILTEKELAVLELLADCKNKQAMASDLGVSIRTIEHHRTQLMRKLKTNSIAGLLRFALNMRRSAANVPEKSHLSGQNGNGFGTGTEEFVPHNGYHAQRSAEVPLRRRNSK